MLYAIAGGALTIAEVQSGFPTTRTLTQQQESSMPLFAGNNYSMIPDAYKRF